MKPLPPELTALMRELNAKVATETNADRRYEILADVARAANNGRFKAAATYVLRRDRQEHPQGWFDDGGRWYPADAEAAFVEHIRSPSRRWPYSKMVACRSLRHCCALNGIGSTAGIRELVRAIDAAVKPAEQKT